MVISEGGVATDAGDAESAGGQRDGLRRALLLAVTEAQLAAVVVPPAEQRAARRRAPPPPPRRAELCTLGRAAAFAQAGVGIFGRANVPVWRAMGVCRLPGAKEQSAVRSVARP